MEEKINKIFDFTDSFVRGRYEKDALEIEDVDSMLKFFAYCRQNGNHEFDDITKELYWLRSQMINKNLRVVYR